MSNSSIREKCTATTAEGRPCRKDATWGLAVCSVHAGARVGRPTLLNADMAERVLQVLRAGGYDVTAAAAGGVGTTQFYEWLRRGDPAGNDPKDAPHRAFRAQVEKARADAEVRSVALIANAAKTQWQAAAWLLERRYPDRWARPSQRDKDEGPAPAPAARDPFAEVDELAQRRKPVQ